jgi:hypothetical protein
VFRRVEISKVGAVGPGCSGTKVALLADDRRVAPLRFVEACLVDLSSVRLICVVDPRYWFVTYIPADLARAPFNFRKDFWVALRRNALVE